MKSKVSRKNSFVRVITIPYRALCKARDFYVRSITDCSDVANYRPTNMRGRGLPKSYSVRSSLSSESEDFRELVRASSSRRTDLELELELELYLQQQKKVGAVSRAEMPRSSSVGMGSIDEDRPCNNFGEMNVNLKRELKYPRSRSHAMGSIDEDRPCNNFGEMNVNLKRELKYPRSRSHAEATSASLLI